MSEKQTIEAGNSLPQPLGSRPDWMSDEAFVIGYAAEHLEEADKPTGHCVGCRHYCRAADSCAPAEGDWCYLCAGVGGEDRWGECPALISANTEGQTRGGSRVV